MYVPSRVSVTILVELLIVASLTLTPFELLIGTRRGSVS